MKKSKNTSPKISVIIPVYKVEKYLDRCLQSVTKQTYDNLEIILVDDGSPDNCPQICDEWAKKDNRIIVIHKENAGVSSARNLGLDKATGEYVTFVDSDDTIDESMYEKMMKLMKDNVDLVFCRFKFISLNGEIENVKEINITELEKDKNNVESFYYRPTKYYKNQNTMGSIWRVIFRNKLLKTNNLNFNTGIKIQEDKEFVLRVLNCCNGVKVLDENLYNYYQTPNSALTNSKNYKNIVYSHQTLYDNELITLSNNKNISKKTLDIIKRKCAIDYLTTIFYRHILGNAPKNEIKNLYKDPFIKKLLKNGKIVFNTKFISYKKQICYCLIKMRMIPILKLMLKIFKYGKAGNQY